MQTVEFKFEMWEKEIVADITFDYDPPEDFGPVAPRVRGEATYRKIYVKSVDGEEPGDEIHVAAECFILGNWDEWHERLCDVCT